MDTSDDGQENVASKGTEKVRSIRVDLIVFQSENGRI